MSKITKKQATTVLKGIRAKYGYPASDPNGPQLQMKFDWLGDGGYPAIVWEGGPYEWACENHWLMFDEVFVEPITNWALGIFPPA